jgi:hypothetical protein
MSDNRLVVEDGGSSVVGGVTQKIISVTVGAENKIETTVVKKVIEVTLKQTGAAQSSGGNGLSDQFVYDPDEEAPHDNVYNDFALMMEKVVINEGRKYIQFLRNCEIPAGDYDMSYVSWLGGGNPFYSGTGIVVTIPEEGVTFSNIASFEVGKGLMVNNLSQDYIYSIPAMTPIAIKFFEGATILNMNCPFVFNDGYFTINSLEGAVANPTPFFGSGEAFVEQSSSGITQILFGGISSMLFNDIIKGSGGLQIIQQGDLFFDELVFGGSMPALQNFAITNAEFSGTTQRISTIRADHLPIDPIDGMDAAEVQTALEELRASGGANDVASVAYDLSDKIASLSGYWSGNIFAKALLTRTGRQVDGFITIIGLPDAVAPDEIPELPLTTLMVRGEDLPFQPRNFGNISEDVEFPLTEPGGFGILQNQVGEVSASSAVGSACSNFGGLLGEVPALIFFNVSNETAGQLSTIVSDNNPMQLVGAQFNAFVRVRYEAAYAEGEEPQAISISGTFPDVELGDAYDETVAIVGETEELYITDFEVAGGSLPDGLTLELGTNALRLYGTPTNTGAFSFTVILEDNLGNLYYPVIFNMDVTEPVALSFSWAGGSYPQAYKDIAYSRTLFTTYEDPSQLPITAELISGTLPTGLVLGVQDDYKVRLSGTPSAEGTFNFRIRVTDQFGTTDEEDASMVVNPYNPEHEPLYLGTVSGNSYNINFENGWQNTYSAENIDTWTAAHATEGMILKIRSGTMNKDFGEGPISVPIGDYMIFEGGYWRHYTY